jgi:hypothetical protein
VVKTFHILQFFLDSVRMDIHEIDLGGCGLDSSGSGNKLVTGICENDSESSGTLKWREFFE